MIVNYNKLATYQTQSSSMLLVLVAINLML